MSEDPDVLKQMLQSYQSAIAVQQRQLEQQAQEIKRMKASLEPPPSSNVRPSSSSQDGDTVHDDKCEHSDIRREEDARVQADIKKLQTQMQSVMSELAQMKRAVKGTSTGWSAPDHSGAKEPAAPTTAVQLIPQPDENPPPPPAGPNLSARPPDHRMAMATNLAIPSMHALQEHDKAFAPTQAGHFDGLITLGNAAEHAAADSLRDGAHRTSTGAPGTSDSGNGAAYTKKGPKRQRAKSLQLNLDEEQVIAELRQRGLIKDKPPDDPKPVKGGRPPLGMGPFKRIKTMYDERQLTMEGWRLYYADKCLQHGYEGGFRKDLRPRLQPQKFTAAPLQRELSMRSPTTQRTLMSLSFPASDPTTPPSDIELRLLDVLCRSLNYPEGFPTDEQFTWDRVADAATNVAALHTYFASHRVTRMRRGKKPDGMLEFPMVYDLWSLELIESTQFKRTCKLVGVPLDELTEQAKQVRKKNANERAASKRHGTVLDNDDEEEQMDEDADVDAAGGGGPLTDDGLLMSGIDEVAKALEHGQPSSAIDGAAAMLQVAPFWPQSGGQLLVPLPDRGATGNLLVMGSSEVQVAPEAQAVLDAVERQHSTEAVAKTRGLATQVVLAPDAGPAAATPLFAAVANSVGADASGHEAAPAM